MLTTQDLVDSSRDLPSMIHEQLDLESRHSLSSSDISDREHGSLRSDSFNGFDHGNIVMPDIFEHDELASTQNRLETFQLWPASSPIKPVDLAAAGFYYLGADDQVKCYKCDLILRQWRLGEDPWVEHKRFRPSCPFIREIDSGKRFQVTCKPIELSSSANKDKGKFLFSQRVTGYGELGYPPALAGEQYAPSVASHKEPVLADPSFSPYPKRLREHVTNEERAFDFQERPYMAPRPSNAGNRQTGFPSRIQEFQGRDGQNAAYHRPEQSVTEPLPRNQYVVVRQGSDQVHIQGAAVYQLHPEDNVYVRVEGQGFPRQLSSVKELKSSHPNRNEASESQSETMSTGPHPTSKESNLSAYVPESRKHQRPFTEASGESGRPFAYETRPFETGSGIPVYTPQHGGGRVVQPPAMSTAHQDRRHFQQMGDLKSGDDKPHAIPVWQRQSARAANMFPAHSGQAYHEPYMAQNKGTNEESSGMPHFPEPESQTGVAETNSREHSVQGSRSRFPCNVAFPMQTPSLGTVQRPLFKQEEARHVTSPSEMSSEHHRLTTFVDWPQDCPIREWELSVAGFYYLGSGDNVKCYKCGIALRNWDPTDTPWGEHKKWSPNCPLVIEHFSGRDRREENVQRQRMTSRERFTFSPEELHRHRSEQHHGGNYWQVPVNRSGSPPRCPGEQSEQRPTQTICTSSSQFCSLAEQGNRPSYSQRLTISSLERGHVVSGPEAVASSEVIPRPENVSLANETSISHSEHSSHGSPALELDTERLAEMGFTQKEIDEAVSKRIEETGSTFDSFGELVLALLQRHDERPADQESSPHTPLDENETRPRPLVTIPTIITSPLFREVEGNRARSSASAVSSPTTPKPQKDSLRRCLSAPVASMCESEESLEQKLERMQEERTCKICMDEEVSVVFQPCGHLSCCAECASGMELCPMCRAPIQEKIRTYLS